MQRADIAELKRRLLVFGGSSFQSDEFLEKQLPPNVVEALLANGCYRPGPPDHREPGDPNDCHHNAEALSCREGYLWMFGLALSPDGRWRAHSWCMTTAGGLVETTGSDRIGYFGIFVPAGVTLGPTGGLDRG